MNVFLNSQNTFPIFTGLVQQSLKDTGLGSFQAIKTMILDTFHRSFTLHLWGEVLNGHFFGHPSMLSTHALIASAWLHLCHQTMST